MSNAEAAKVISEAKKRGQEKAQEGVPALVEGYKPPKHARSSQRQVWRTLRRFSAWNEKYEHDVPCIGTN